MFTAVVLRGQAKRDAVIMKSNLYYPDWFANTGLAVLSESDYKSITTKWYISKNQNHHWFADNLTGLTKATWSAIWKRGQVWSKYMLCAFGGHFSQQWILPACCVSWESYISMVGIPADQNSTKWRSTGNIWNLAYWISNSLLYWDISHIHLSYDEQVLQVQLKQVYWRILYVKWAFSHKWVIPNYRQCYVNELTFNGDLFSFIELLTIFCAIFTSYLMVINSKNINQNIQTLFSE